MQGMLWEGCRGLQGRGSIEGGRFKGCTGSCKGFPAGDLPYQGAVGCGVAAGHSAGDAAGCPGTVAVPPPAPGHASRIPTSDDVTARSFPTP